MADHTIHCDIVSAEGEIFSGAAKMVFVPAAQGELGIAPRHAPLLSLLKAGEVRVLTPDGQELFFFVGGGGDDGGGKGAAGSGSIRVFGLGGCTGCETSEGVSEP